MKRLNITFLSITLITCSVWSQQDPLSSHYMFNTMAYNPGIAGTSGMICATALNRQQWLGFDGAPSTTLFHITAPVAPFRIKSGVGLLLKSDNIGFDRDIGISGIYSYLMDVGMGKLGIGVSFGVINKSLEPNWFIPSGDEFTQANEDPLIPVNKESLIAFDAGAGVYYRTDRYYASVSVTHINQPKIKYTKENSTAISYISRHYYVTGGYTVQLSNPAFQLLPSVFGFSDGKTIQFSITTLIQYNKKVWGGVSYIAGDALTGIIGLELYNGIRIGYAYDFPLSDVRKSTSGSHEFMVNYCFDISLGKSPMRYKSIRFL